MLRVSVGSRRLVAAVSGKLEEPLMSACSRSSRRLTAFACSLQASRSAAVFSLLGLARYQPSEDWNQSSGVWNLVQPASSSGMARSGTTSDRRFSIAAPKDGADIGRNLPCVGPPCNREAVGQGLGEACKSGADAIN